jgi:hypothetical protein
MSDKKENLENLLENLLSEGQPPERPQSMADFAPVEQKDLSLDQVIDKYFVQYEREAIPTSEVYESASVGKLTGYLFEQDEEEPPEDEEEPAGGDLDLGADLAGAAGPGGDEGGGLDMGLGDEPEAAAGAEDEAPPVVQTPQINLQDFARSVARLVNNLQSLIDVRTILLNRAEAYIQSNYDERTAKELMELLDTNYDLRPADLTNHYGVDNEEYPQPRTAVTGPAGG